MIRRNREDRVTTRANNDGERFRRWLIRSLLTMDGLLIFIAGLLAVNCFRS